MQKLKKFILQQSSEPGFTLIELILTILLIGIFTAIAMIRTQTGLTNIQEQIAIDQITSDIDLARSMAFAKHETIKIVFDTSNESYTIYTDASGTFTTISDFPNSDNGVISFNSPMLNSVDIEDVDFGDVVNELKFLPLGELYSGGTINLNTKEISIETVSGKWSVE